METVEAIYSEMSLRFPDARLVFGEGNAHCPSVMLIGEAPGAQEEQQLRPFVGKAGQNLNEFLQLAELDRARLFVSNTVKIRPSEIGPTGRVRNRKPSSEEIAAFTPFLLREIAAVSPAAIVTLGNTPLQALLGKNAVIGAVHGAWQTSALYPLPCPIFPLYHPASLIYRPQLKDVYTQDILAFAAWERERNAGALPR